MGIITVWANSANEIPAKREWVEAACHEIISKVSVDLMNVRQNGGLEYGDVAQQEQVRQHMAGAPGTGHPAGGGYYADGDRHAGGGGGYGGAGYGAGGYGAAGDYGAGANIAGSGAYVGSGYGASANAAAAGGYGAGTNMGAHFAPPPETNSQPALTALQLQEQQHLMQAMIARQQREMAAQMAKVENAAAAAQRAPPPHAEHTPFPSKRPPAPQEHNGFGGLDLETVCPQLMKGMKKTATINIEVPESLASVILMSSNILAEWRQFSGAEIDLTPPREGNIRMLTMFGSLSQVQIAYVAISQKMFQLAAGAS